MNGSNHHGALMRCRQLEASCVTGLSFLVLTRSESSLNFKPAAESFLDFFFFFLDVVDLASNKEAEEIDQKPSEESVESREMS